MDDSKESRATQQHFFRYLSVSKTIAAAVALFVYFGMPVSYTHAGILSFFSDIFGGGREISLSHQNSQNMALLQAALNVDPNPSKGGGDITIVGDTALLPDVGPLGTIADVEEVEHRSDRISVYVVRKGDSLSQIAEMFGVSANTIIWANDIPRGGLIREGQTLVILPVSGVRYTVKSGDTLGSIAKKYGGSVEEIMQFNDIANASDISVGVEIVIPDGEIGTTSYRSSSVATTRVRGISSPSYDGYYIRPVAGRRTQGLHGFNAVDLGAPHGAPVVAAAGGRVLITRASGWNGGYGIYVVVAHDNGTQTLYAHLSRLIVSSGSTVVQGQVIGYVGSSGRSTGPHLHFEVRGAQQPF